MNKINPPIELKVSIPNLPSETWQYFEVGEPVRLRDLKKGDLFFKIYEEMKDIYMIHKVIHRVPDSVNEGMEDEKKVIEMKHLERYWAYEKVTCNYEFEAGHYERLLAYLIPAGCVRKLLFPLIAKNF
jgi:hypothetical protein